MANRIVTDLTADSSGLDASLDQMGSSINGWGGRIASGFSVAAAATAALGAAVSVAGGWAVVAYGKQEEAEKKLESVLRATGNAAGWSADQMKLMAAQLQQTSVYGDEVVISAQAVLATFKDIKGDQFRETMQAAADMSSVLGTDLQGAVMQLGKALNDPAQGLTALSRSGVSFTQQQKDQIKAMQQAGDMVGAQTLILAELRSEFGGTAAAMADTFGGRIQQLKNRLGDLGEKIGGALVPALGGMADWVGKVMTFVEQNTGSIQRWIGAVGDVASAIGETLGGALKAVATVYAGYWAAMETVILNWSDAAEFALTAFEYSFVKAFNVLEHTLTVAAPAYFEWFVNNAGRMMVDYGNATAAIFSNMYENITTFFSNVYAWLTGGEVEWKWTGLLDGFEATMDELPKIAERVSGELEASLGNRMETLGGKLGSFFQSRFNERLKAFGLLGIDAAGSGPDVGAPAFGIGRDFAGAPEAAAAASAGAASRSRAGGFEDIAALYKRIAGAAASDPAEKTARATEKTAEATEKSARATEEMVELMKRSGPPLAVLAPGR